MPTTQRFDDGHIYMREQYCKIGEMVAPTLDVLGCWWLDSFTSVAWPVAKPIWNDWQRNKNPLKNQLRQKF